ncbi:MAG TPA: site-2 protease family protein [Burkholderiaceae bacterium]|jgi:Zn-dependent protease|nr:site-2 protease family protein [Burkholderiaceae bacterium]
MSRLFLLLFAGLKFSKLFLMVGSMLLSIGVYALVFGWRYAVGFVVLLFVHEAGHLIAARQRGLDVGLPTFIPFMGAWIQLKQRPHDAETEAYVGLGGPLLGTIGALICYFMARSYQLPWLLAVAYVGFFLNLFNLIPLPPLDGGRITAVLSPRIWLAGAGVLAMLLWYRFSPILLVVAVLSLPNILAAFRYRANDPAHQGYFQASLRVRWEYGIVYVVLLAFLAVMTNETDKMLHAGTFEPPATEDAQSL